MTTESRPVPVRPRSERGSRPPEGESASSLAPDLLEQARYRLRRLALIFVTLSAVALALAIANALSDDVVGTDTGARLGVGLHGTLLALELALFAVARSRRVSDSAALHAALVWEVAMCVVISTGEPWIAYEERHMVPALTWASLVIVSVPLIIPLPPTRMLVAALMAAATAPLALLALERAGAIAIGRNELMGSLVSPTFAVVLSYFGGRALYGMTRDVATARRMGSYVLESLIGRGGMGEVWRARHRMLARPAAIKLIRRELSRDTAPGSRGSAVLRFEREAHVTATLRSPHTVQLYDFGMSSDGQLYYVMELLDGVDLETLVRKFGPQPVDRVVSLIRQACRSLEEAHETGLVHRDIKPANIQVCRYGRELDFVKVLDFGLVALQPKHAADETALTTEGQIRGTPAYMPPELATSPDQVDGRTDLYALGCVAFWLLTGQTVFSGNSAVEVIAEHLRTEPRAPSSVADAPIPEQLDQLILACLAKTPAERPDSAAALEQALAAVPACGDWDPAARGLWWSRYLPGGGDEARAEPTRSIDASGSVELRYRQMRG